MRWLRVIALVLVFAGACTTSRPGATASDETLLNALVSLERGALDRWVRLDPGGYLDLYASEITYFDANTEQRVAGIEAMRMRLASMKELKPQFTESRYELIEPKVQPSGDMAILTFNLITYGKPIGSAEERELARWNSSEVYRRSDGGWRIIHSHWSFVQGMPRTAGSM
jgi:ketosteroid isomerase-like protein